MRQFVEQLPNQTRIPNIPAANNSVIVLAITIGQAHIKIP